MQLQPWHPRLIAYTHVLRFATASMLRRQFPQWLTSERTAHRHLATLVEQGYLAIADPWAVGRNFPYVYHATPAGVRLVKRRSPNSAVVDASPAEQKRTRGYGLHSLLHELFISEMMIDLTRTVGERDDVRLLELERRYFRNDRRLTYVEDGERKSIEPDLGFLPEVRGERGAWSALPMHFVEMENGTHSMKEIGDKLKAYHQWAKSESDEYLTAEFERLGASQPKPDFRLLIVCHDKYGEMGDCHVLANWLIQSLELPRHIRSRIWLATVEILNVHSGKTSILNHRVWYRANDARQWLAAYREFVRGSSDRRKSRQFARHRDFIKQQLPTMRRHALLPNRE